MATLYAIRIILTQPSMGHTLSSIYRRLANSECSLHLLEKYLPVKTYSTECDLVVGCLIRIHVNSKESTLDQDIQVTKVNGKPARLS